MLNYVGFLLLHGAGCFFFAWLSDRRPGAALQVYKRMILPVPLLTVVLTSAMAFSHGIWLSAVIFLLGFFSGFFVAFLQHYMYGKIPGEKAGVSIGYAFGAAFTINFLFFVLLFPQQEGGILYFKTFFSAILALFAGIFIYVSYADGRVSGTEDIHPAAIAAGKKESIRPSLFFMLSAISFLFYLIIGIQDYFVTYSWLASGDDTILYTRIFCIIGNVAAGILCDYKGRHTVILLSMGMIIAGLIPTLFGYTGIFAFVCFSFIQLAAAGFALFIRVVFADMAVYAKKPVTMLSLGFALPYLLKDPGILAGGMLQPYGPIFAFVACILLTSVMIPLIAQLFVKIRDMHAGNLAAVISGQFLTAAEEDHTRTISSLPAGTPEAQAVPSSVPDSAAAAVDLVSIAKVLSEKYSLSERESQVLNLILLGQTPLEMAYRLYISESTVRFHIRNILKKTGAGTRVQLISTVITKSRSKEG